MPLYKKEKGVGWSLPMHTYSGMQNYFDIYVLKQIEAEIKRLDMGLIVPSSPHPL